MKRNQSGFTLIEIAIVLVIIGLLLGGVLKGQELINSAKVKNLATDFRNIPVFIYGYQDKFRSLPGDDASPDTHVSGTKCTGAAAVCSMGNGIINGKWDSATVADETQLFWEHIRLAGLATGPTTGTDLLPTNAGGGLIGITNGGTDNPDPAYALTPATALHGTYVICSGGILGKFAKQLDIQMDDGSLTGGSMRAFKQGARGTALTAPGTIDDATPYVVCMGV
ncbi:MAG: prepilin-type N-terminal cleavage/methylation domain-containing protein [Gallionella sp.]|nr:prepilin-type N-terminal cleavage/methylation domain-containing protein [Gallionella sp.]